MFERWEVFSRQFCYDACIGPSLRSSSQPISIWAFLPNSFTFVVQTSYYHIQSSYFGGFLTVERHVLQHLHALRVALGTRKCKRLFPDFFGSQFVIKRMRSSFVFGNNVSSFSHRGSKTFCLFPSNLATPGNMIMHERQISDVIF